MEFWIMNTDYNLWKIIQNGNNKKSLGRDSKGGIIILPPVSFEEHVAVQREKKARNLLLHSLPKDHMADFHHLDYAREIWLAVKARFSDHAGNAAGSVYDAAAEFAMIGISPKAKIENKEWEVKLVESLARFDKWKESSKNLVKLINSSMSTRTKLGLGFKECIAGEMHEVTFGSKSNTSSINSSESNDFVSCDNSDKSSKSKTYDFASCVSIPKTNDSFSTVDVKILPKYDVKDPSPTNGLPSCSFKENVKPPRNLCNKSGIVDRIHCKNNFVRTKTCFVCGSKSHLIKDCDVYDNVDNFPSDVLNAAFVPAGSRNSSASIHAGRSIPAASRNRPASIHAGRYIPAGRSVPTGWTNHAARPFFRPTTLYFDNVSWPRIYDHMSMNEGI
nr:xylulose kinase-1 [Tanacetum cinerariifolium]